MNGISEWFVGLLLLPVTIFILIPLLILVIWLVARFFGRTTRLGARLARPTDYKAIKFPSFD